MKRDTLRPTLGTLERFAPVLVTIGIVVIAYFLFISPRIADALRSRQEARSTENRVRTMQGLVARGSAEKVVVDKWPMEEFDRRTPARDRTSDIVEELAQLAQLSAPAAQMKTLTIDTGERVVVEPPASASAPRAVNAAQVDRLDPRFELFERTLQYTPVTVSFASSYRGIGNFIWRIRDLPATIEIRSLELTRGLPLMTAKLIVFVLQRMETPGAAATPGVRAAAPTVTTVDPFGYEVRLYYAKEGVQVWLSSKAAPFVFENVPMGLHAVQILNNNTVVAQDTVASLGSGQTKLVTLSFVEEGMGLQGIQAPGSGSDAKASSPGSTSAAPRSP